MSEPPRRVHIVIDSLVTGGAENLLAEQARGLLEAGAEVEVSPLQAGDGPARAALEELGIAAEPIGTTGLLGRRDRDRVAAVLQASGPQLVHTHLGYADLLGGRAAARLGIPVVSTVHIARWGPSRRDHIKEALMARQRRRNAVRVITVSEALRRDYLARFSDRPERVVAAHNGLDLRLETDAGAALRRQLAIATDEVVVTMLSVLREGKGHREALAALARLDADCPGVELPRHRLLIAGDGPAGAAIAAAAEAQGDRVLLLGHRSDRGAVLAATDILLHPSHADALPSTVIEAMSAGLAIIASAVGGIPELVGDDEAILTAAPPEPGEIAAALRALLGDRARRRRLGVAAQARYRERFTTAAWTQRLLAIYAEALDQGPRREPRSSS